MPAPFAQGRKIASRFARPAAELRRYRVFISYSHADTKWARWLMRRLEGYAVPKRFHGRAAPIGAVGKRIAPVFRDRDELPTTSDLGETIRNALRESATLVVICSPASARSRWVQEEIRAFKQLHGERSVFAFIVGGEPKAHGAADDCFSKALRWEVDADGEFSGVPAEVVAADARSQADGPKLAFVRLIAGLLGVGFDELRQRELQRRNRRLTLIAASSAAGMALTLGLAVVAWQARNDARRRLDQAEGVLTFMVGDFREELKKIGRLTLLDKVGVKAMAYFDALDERDLTDTALARQAKALTQIGENQFEQAHYGEAARAFVAAYQRASALVVRQPKNGEMLFERAQAEYWIGYVHWRQRQLPQARAWFTRYRDSTTQLVKFDRSRPAWMRELAYGHHNLAVLELDDAKFTAARAGFEAEVTTLAALVEAGVSDPALEFQLADAHSWLGSIAERSGDYNEAARRFAEHVARLHVIVRGAPGTAKWRARLVDALALQARILANTGYRAEALARRHEAVAISEALVRSDPANRQWFRASVKLRLNAVDLVWANGDLSAAAALSEEVVEKLEKLAVEFPKDADVATSLAMGWRLAADVRVATGRADPAGAAQRAIELGERLLHEVPANEAIIGECAHARVVAGRIAARAGDPAGARAHWHRALELTEQRSAASNHWRVLVPAALALWELERPEPSRALIARLHRLGFRPLQPWPVGAAETILSETPNR